MLIRSVVIISSFSLLVACNQHEISFSHDVKPIINSRCAGCHGGVKKHGGLSLLSKEEALSPSPKTGVPVIKAGSAKESDLYKRLVSSDPDYAMPRDHEPLPPHEVEIIKKWINEGAKWENHWAYNPIELPSVPKEESEWVQTDIDHFILRKLQEKGLEPNKDIEKRKLVRRVSLDITGLPPEREIIEAYLNNALAYESLVDSLLFKSSYGEHWATMWLDLARYADSKGYEKDPHRNIWRFREWVINALNNDMPFDQFTKAQLAGDLISPHDEEMLIATSFLRNSMTNTEGGTDDEEFRVAAVIDRMNTTYEIWQGTTIACAQCHDHPYDPISQKEFYQSMSYFNNTMDADLSGEYPVLEIFDQKTEEEISELVAFISNLEKRTIDPNLPAVEKIKEAIYPKILPQDCDDFFNMLIFPDGIMSNWTNNVNDMKGRKFYFMFEDIEFEKLKSIKATYATSGEKAFIKVNLDSLNGELIHSSGFTKTKSVSGHEWSGRHEWKILDIKMPQNIHGQHDVLFEILNPTLEVPDGIVLFKEFELIYHNKEPIKDLEKEKERLITLRSKADKTPILRAKSSKLRRLNQVHVRGNQRTRGDTVDASIPNIFNRKDITIQNREELANWLMDDSNIMTARVIVNRIWAYIFNNGIVSTLEDFGSQGEKPTHPELLDFLAYRFIHTHRWSIKGLIKEIIMSNTYRQSSKANEEKIKIDPYNRYYSRGPRIRLSAEQIRDQVLTLSGQLYDSIGGPSVMPPQPEGVWQTVYNNSQWKESVGSHKYRRGLYTYWKRSSPYPSMEAFDSPTREVCRSKRIMTNTPNQALVTMNDPVYIDAANKIGKAMDNYTDDVEKKIDYLYQKSFYHDPDEKTKAVLVNLYKKAEQKLIKTQIDGKSMLESPSAVVAHSVLNLDATLNKS